MKITDTEIWDNWSNFDTLIIYGFITLKLISLINMKNNLV